MKKLSILPLILLASPAYAASGLEFSLNNTNFVVLLAFLLFVAVVLYLKVPRLVTGQLDKRADGIRDELDEARALREEAQTILASYERKQKEVQVQSVRIIEHAKEEAALAAEVAKQDLKKSIARRLAAAQDQIASAQEAAVKEVRDSAVTVAVAAASDVIAKQMTATEGNKLIESAIKDVESKLH